MFSRVMCSLSGHKIDRKRVWHDDINFRTRCRRCGAPLLRSHDGWQIFDSEVHGSAKRSPHPHHDE